MNRTKQNRLRLLNDEKTKPLFFVLRLGASLIRSDLLNDRRLQRLIHNLNNRLSLLSQRHLL